MGIGKMGFRGPDTVIGAGVVFNACTLKGTGVVRVDGEFNGAIELSGHLILGDGGIIKGEVHADSGLFAGKYFGNLHIKDVLHIASTGEITGKIISGKLIVDEGASVTAHCSVTKAGVMRRLPAGDNIAASDDASQGLASDADKTSIKHDSEKPMKQ